MAKATYLRSEPEVTGMLRIWLMAMLAAAMFGVVRHTEVLHRAGLTGYCTTAPHPAGTTGHWRVCEKGVLNGRPDLSRQRCTRRGQDGSVEYWRCPARVRSAALG